MTTTPARFFTTPQLAQHLGIAPWTVREWARRGLIVPAWRVGHTIRWDPEQVAADLARATAEGRG